MSCLNEVYSLVQILQHDFLSLQLINVEYQADEQGFRVLGDHLPTPPPVSPEIQAGLDLIYEGIRVQAERRKNDPEYAKGKEERDRLNYLGLYIGN